MRDLQEVFNKRQRIIDDIRRIRKDYRDMLANDGDYARIKDAYDAARREKKNTELAIQASMGGAYEKLQELSDQRRALEEMLSDIAMTQLMRGETIELTDDDHNRYEPQYKITFKKSA